VFIPKEGEKKIPLLLSSKEQLAADVVLMLFLWGWSATAVFKPKGRGEKIPLLSSKEQWADVVLMLLHQRNLNILVTSYVSHFRLSTRALQRKKE
jgi:hypothetical protein